VLLKLSRTLLTWKPTTLTVQIEPLQRIRAAQHGAEAWVVLDVSGPGRWQRRTHARGLVLTGGQGAAWQAVDQAPMAEADRSTARGAVAGATYQVVGAAVEDMGEKTRLTITTDGPLRYRLEKEPRGEQLTLHIYGAALTWNGLVSGLPTPSVRRLVASAETLEGEPAVKISVHLIRAMPYAVFKEQNQVVLEVDHPTPATEAPPARGNLRARVSVDFQNAELASALRALAQDAGYDLILTPGAQELSGPSGQVTVSVNEQPFENVMDLILRPRTLAWEVNGNTLRVGVASEFPTETRVFSLRNLDAKRANLKESLETSLTEGSHGKIIVDEAANRVIATGIPSDLRKIETIVDRMDTSPRLVTRSFTLNYGTARRMAPLLKPMLSSLASLDVNERDNSLVITDLPGNLPRLASLIRSLDTKSKQVMIEAKIIEVNLSNETDLGINWSAASRNQDPVTSASSSPRPFLPVGRLSIGTVQPNFNLNATLSVLEAKGAVNTISNPRIATLDNQSATLSATQNIPYANSYTSNGVVKTGVEYLELPITLTVTPQITKNNQVMFNPAVLSVTTVVGAGNPPETSTRSASTQMLVADGETVAIGGMVRDANSTRESKVPLLGDIPLLGYLFKSTVVTKNKVELVVFLTPHVLE
jgi:type IV pilus assembly protein PilQ